MHAPVGVVRDCTGQSCVVLPDFRGDGSPLCPSTTAFCGNTWWSSSSLVSPTPRQHYEASSRPFLSLGFMVRRVGILDKDSTKALSKVTLSVLLPSLLLTRLALLEVSDIVRARYELLTFPTATSVIAQGS